MFERMIKMQKINGEVSITNKSGLHARPASLFVQEANRYQAKIEISFNDRKVNAKSILAILSLGIHKGSTIVLDVEGEDAEAALLGLKHLIEEELPKVDGEV